jgi:hypothetical protein
MFSQGHRGSLVPPSVLCCNATTAGYDSILRSGEAGICYIFECGPLHSYPDWGGLGGGATL